MSKPIKVSIDLTLLGEIAKTGHSAIKRAGKNNHAYASIDVWVNDRTDNYGNDVSITLSSTKAGRDSGEKKVYIGNGKSGAQNNAASGWGQTNNPAPAPGHNNANNTPPAWPPQDWNPNQGDEGLPF